MSCHKIFLILSIFIMFSCEAANSGTEPKLEEKVTITSVNHLSVYEVWNSVPVERTAIGDVVVALYKFDVEALPVEGDKKFLAVVLVGELGTGINPVGFKISSAEASGVKVTKISDNVNSPSFELLIGKNIKYKLVVMPDKKVFVESKYMGTIQ